MAIFLDNLEPYKDTAIRLFSRGKRPDRLFFSGSTYQFFFKEEEDKNSSYETHLDEPSWVFIQIAPDGEVSDIFCSCSHSSKDTRISLEEHSYDGAVFSGGCIHMALSWLTLFSRHGTICEEDEPLHQRFYDSSLFQTLFYSLFKYEKEINLRRKKIEKPKKITNSFPTTAGITPHILFHDASSKGFEATFQTGKESISSCSFSGEQTLIEYCQKVYEEALREEIEETSIKFSNVSEDEIDAWRRGEPSIVLQYELSPLSEIAKALFLYTEGALDRKTPSSSSSSSSQPPSIYLYLHEDKKTCDIRVEFSSLLQGQWSDIPYEILGQLFHSIANAGASFQSSPRIIDMNHIIPESCTFHFDSKLRQAGKLSLSYQRYAHSRNSVVEDKYISELFSDWYWDKKHNVIIYERSFADSSDQEAVYDSPHIEKILDELHHRRCITPHIASISQKIDINCRLNEISITSEAMIQGEKTLLEDEPYRIGRWVLRPNKEAFSSKSPYQIQHITFIKACGFFSIPYPKYVVSRQAAPEFLMQHQMWLMSQPGFQLHCHSQEQNIGFRVDMETGALYFISQKKKPNSLLAKGNKKSEECSFGIWTWRKGEGFFLSPQSSLQGDLAKGENPSPKYSYQARNDEIQSGKISKPILDTAIPPHRVSHVIRDHTSFLKRIPGFFSEESPIQSTGLKISYEAKYRRIDLSLCYTWRKPEYEKNARYYDEYGYLSDEGFFKMPMLPVQETVTRYIYEKDKEEWDRFFLDQLPSLQNEYLCQIDPRLRTPQSLELYCNKMSPIALQGGTDALKAITTNKEGTSFEWEADFFWKGTSGDVTLQEVLLAVSRGIRFLPTQAGVIDIEDERFLWVHALARKSLTSKKKRSKKEAQESDPSAVDGNDSLRTGKYKLKLQAYDFLRIQAHDTVHFEKEDKRNGVQESQKNFLHRLLHATPATKPSLEYLKSDLRPYQRNGLEWLWFLYTSGLSGLLCDDMGVGKTHQAMALMAAVYADKENAANQHKKNTRSRFLIVCPTSLVWHWKEKLERFLPDLEIYSYFGGARSIQGLSGEWNVFLTTYGIWRNEVSLLSKLHFDVAIFDELQIAKNHVSLIWAALAQVKASMRLGLTGTPIENQLRELKALFDLVLPGYLPDDSLFREFYVRPIERGVFDSRKALLARSIRPFVLRRKKEEVLPELPIKTEEVFLTELLGDQKALYRHVASLQGVPLIHQLQDETQPIPYMHIFALLSALKQVSNHPACYLKDIENYKKYESGKWQVFQELIEEAKESGQKVVVFSQYLNMLDIMAQYLNEMGITYTEIRGRTRLRGKAIEQFQKDPECLVFLGSLQAAGLGIDLTSASIVIHYDRWWNAARENQATDRVHRIGQSRGVQVIKMITKETVEESIDKMIARKSSLLEEVIHYDDHQIVKKLNRQELLELLQGI